MEQTVPTAASTPAITPATQTARPVRQLPTPEAAAVRPQMDAEM